MVMLIVVSKDNTVVVGKEKFVSQFEDVESELKRDTVGLVALDEFQKIKKALEHKRQQEVIEAANRKERYV